MDERARRFLEGQRVAHLATADASAAPHVVPICFALIDDVLYVAIDEKPKRGEPRQLRRLKNILENPRVAIVADLYDDQDWSKLGFVLVHGSARILDGGTEHAAALAVLRAKYVQYRTMELEDRPVIAVDIERTRVWGQMADGERE